MDTRNYGIDGTEAASIAGIDLGKMAESIRLFTPTLCNNVAINKASLDLDLLPDNTISTQPTSKNF